MGGVTAGAEIGSSALTAQQHRVVARGKFLFVGGQKLYLKGVTYGTFRPDEAGAQFPEIRIVRRDFEAMRAHGINSIRTYTVPPAWLLDEAHTFGIYVLVGIPWEQHITFLDDHKRRKRIVDDARRAVRACHGRPAVLGYLIGNEIPASIVRWYGSKRIEGFLRQLYRAVKREDLAALVSYVNYPTTEYLDLSFLDFVCFNVYLESRDALRAYLARLQNIAGERPLVMAEVGLDSRRNGLDKQAEVLGWQIGEVFAEGCAGTFVFAWTDDWYRGGCQIEDWDFGLTERGRTPKPALLAVAHAFERVPFAADAEWPSISVVICSFNGARTIRDTLKALEGLDYPNFEVILVDDGSSDGTAAIGNEYGARVISTENRGLSSARNTGCEAATGEIVAYIDDDAYPDPQWLRYLAYRLRDSAFVGAGGPNLAPAGDGLIAECVGHAPGGPLHVLLSDTEAEHIPGCNMAFRRTALETVGGFDPIYRAAGDDVDLCWRLMEQGGKIGFHAGAVVWHHRRNSVRTYWKQQRGYGRAEALLERKWPEKYNAPGHLAWAGRIYGRGLTSAIKRAAGQIYQGHAGTAPFQSLYGSAPGLLTALPLMPEWYLLVFSLAAVSALGLAWWPLFAALPLLAAAIAVPFTQALLSATQAPLSGREGGQFMTLRLRALIALLHVLQPIARLRGRLENGLSPWRSRGSGLIVPVPRQWEAWSESWRSPEARARAMAAALKSLGASWTPGGDFDAWDFEVRGGLFASARLLGAVEEHGGGRQMARVRAWPRPSLSAFAGIAVGAALAIGASLSGEWIAALVLGALAVMFSARLAWEAAHAMGAIAKAVHKYREFTP